MHRTDKVMIEHVNAARKWLRKAENSLEQNNNIRSDLHIILAEAEIKRAREKMSDTVKPFWKKYLFPLTLSALILTAGGAFLLDKQGYHTKTSITPPVVVTNTAADISNTKDIPQQIENNGTEENKVDSSRKSQNAELGYQVKQSSVTEETRNSTTDYQKSIVPSRTINVPSREMQQMMRTARNTLQK